jgi:integrase
MARREYQACELHTRLAKGGPVYYIRYREKELHLVEGRPVIVKTERQPTIGPVTMGKRKAERARDEIKQKINRQVYAVQSQVPWDQFIQVYRQNHLPTLADTTQRTYDQWLRVYIEPAFGHRKLSEIGPLDIQAFLLALPVAPTTRASIRGVLASVWQQAARWGYWQERNPMEGIRLGPRPPARERVIWTAEQIRRVLASVREDVGLICETLMWTGMRISECLALRPSAFRLDRGEVEIRERHSRGSTQGTKSEKGTRTLALGYLVDRYAVRLRGMPADAWVFTDINHPERPYNDRELLVNALNPALRRLGLKAVGSGWHTFRRSLASWMNDSGSSPFDIRDQLGHASLDTTAIYIQTGHRRGEVIRGMQEAFLGQEVHRA